MIHYVINYFIMPKIDPFPGNGLRSSGNDQSKGLIENINMARYRTYSGRHYLDINTNVGGTWGVIINNLVSAISSWKFRKKGWFLQGICAFSYSEKNTA